MMECSNLSYQSLLEKFEETRKELGVAEETIRRITGRDPELFNASQGINRWKGPGQPPGRIFLDRKRALFTSRKRIEDEEDPLPGDEESPDEEGAPAKKPALQSTVIATGKDVKSRRDTIHEQNINSKVTARNRRMFGMILGTLQKFQHEEKKRKEQDLKKREIEQKVEAAAEEEKERVKREKEELFTTRKEKQIQLRCLEKKIEIAEMHQVWESSQVQFLHFIQSKSKPPIFFMPASHNEKSRKCLAESRERISQQIKLHRENVEKELSEIDEWYKKDNFPSDKENIGPPEGEDVEEFPRTEQESVPVPEPDNAVAEGEDNNTAEKTMEPLADQEFEPIYDE